MFVIANYHEFPRFACDDDPFDYRLTPAALTRARRSGIVQPGRFPIPH